MGDQIRHREDTPLLQLSRKLLRIQSFGGLVHAVPFIVEKAFGARLVVLDLASHGKFSSEIDEPPAGDGPEVGRQTTLRVSGSAVCSAIPLKVHGEDCGSLVIHGCTLTRTAENQVKHVVSTALERAQSIDHIVPITTARDNARHRRVLADFLAQELRTPLTAIKGAATSLLWIESSPELQRELLTIINEESDRIDRFISAATLLEDPLKLQTGRLPRPIGR